MIKPSIRRSKLVQQNRKSKRLDPNIKPRNKVPIKGLKKVG